MSDRTPVLRIECEISNLAKDYVHMGAVLCEQHRVRDYCVAISEALTDLELRDDDQVRTIVCNAIRVAARPLTFGRRPR